MAPRSLPPRPSLTQLKNHAKDMRKSCMSADPRACQTLRHLQQFSDRTDEEIALSSVTLADVQHAIAKEYGFNGWRELKVHVEGAGGLETREHAGAIRIPRPKGESVNLSAIGVRHGLPAAWRPHVSELLSWIRLLRMTNACFGKTVNAPSIRSLHAKSTMEVSETRRPRVGPLSS